MRHLPPPGGWHRKSLVVRRGSRSRCGGLRACGQGRLLLVAVLHVSVSPGSRAEHHTTPGHLAPMHFVHVQLFVVLTHAVLVWERFAAESARIHAAVLFVRRGWQVLICRVHQPSGGRR